MSHVVVHAMRGLGRQGWIVGALGVVLCAALAARTANDLIEARFLGDATAAPRRAVPRPAAAPPARSPAATVGALVDRNMFCSDCSAAPEAGAPAATSLPLVLIATYLGADPAVTIRNTATEAQGAYGVGDVVPGAGPVERIGGTYVMIRNDASGRTERLELLAPVIAVASSPPPSSPAASAWAGQVQAIDGTTFEVDRSLVRDLIRSGGTGNKVKGVQMMPAIKDGKVVGIRVAQARAGSLAAALGLRPGDVIEAVDGVELASADRLLELVTRVDTAARVAVGARRGGQALQLEYRLR